MAWEWASPVSGALVGIAGVVGGWRVAVGARRNDERLARERNDHELRLEHGRWHREQRADAYLQLLDLAEDVGIWLHAIGERWEDEDPLPAVPAALGQQARVWARISMYASPSVCDEIERWRSCMEDACDPATVLVEFERDFEIAADLHERYEHERAARLAMSKVITEDLTRTR